MTVDFLRSCYRSRFTIDETNGLNLIGRFYRPPERTPIYSEPTIFRSAIWLDEWDRSEGNGDTLEDYSYDNGARDFVVTSDLARTRQAQIGCDKRLVLVPGATGFPLACQPKGIGDLSVRWTDCGYLNTVTMAAFLQGQNLSPLLIPKVGDNLWMLDSILPGSHYIFAASLVGTNLQVLIRAISLDDLHEANSVVSFPLEVGGFQYGPMVPTVTAPWQYFDPMQPLTVTFFNVT